MVIAFPVKYIIGLFSNVHVFPRNAQTAIYQWIKNTTIIWQYQVPFSWVSQSSFNHLLILTMPLGSIFHRSVLLALQLGLREAACFVSSLSPSSTSESTALELLLHLCRMEICWAFSPVKTSARARQSWKEGWDGNSAHVSFTSSFPNTATIREK